MTSELISVAPDGSRLHTPDGNPFFAVIINYVGHSDRAWAQYMPGQFDAALIEADYRLARRIGANAIRTFVASPLQNEFPKGDWSKLDATVRAAERAGVFLLLTLADYGPTYIQTMASHAGMIAARYHGNPTILGYDLRNEPHFYNLAISHYQKPIPLLAPDLSAIYPPKQSANQALAWARDAGRVPTWISDDDAIRYANANAVWLDFLQAATAWTNTRNLAATVVEFMRSPEAAPWQPLLKALDETLAAWLTPQLAAVRAADPGHLVTVGWSDPALAGLQANAALDFMSLHRFPPDSPRWLAYAISMASSLCKAFPRKPVLLTEFGYATSDVEAAQAAVCESAGWLQAFALGLAGAGKWMLWDLPPGPNPRERSFGLCSPSSELKPSAYALPSLSDLLAPSAAARGDLTLSANASGGASYRFLADDARFSSGSGTAGDDLVRWQGQGVGQLFALWPRQNALRIRVTAAGQVTLDLGKVRGSPAVGSYTLAIDGMPLAHTRAGTALLFALTPGQTAECSYEIGGQGQSVDARIAILWPHDNAPVSQAQLANLTAYLTQSNTRWAVACDFTHEVTLWRAQDNEPGRPIAKGVRRLADFDGRRVPVWDFNNIDVSAARDGKTKLYFSVRVADISVRSNVWAHGSDARTFMPEPYRADTELGITAEAAPVKLDARLQILWTQGGLPISQALFANLTADLFLHDTRTRLSPARSQAPWQPNVWLVRGIDNGVGERVAKGVLRAEPNGAAHWDFNDIDISAARNPTSKVHFWVDVDGVRTYSNFWTHGLDARTYLPNPEPPLGNCP